MTNTIPDTMLNPHFVGNGIIDFIEKPVPTPGTGELLIEVKADALCGSERHQFYDGTPTTPGHEIAGIVAATGSNTTIPTGTPGVVFLMVFCGQCRSCLRGFTNQCLNKTGDVGFNRDGGYGKYVLVPENIFFPIDPDISLTEATMLLDIMGTGGHAIQRAQIVHQDITSILVSGAGPIGLAVLAMAKILLGHDLPIIITDTIPYRLDLAQKLGGLPINLKETSLPDGLRHYNTTIDAAIDTSGKTIARRSNLEALNKRGVLVCVGHGETLPLTISTDLIEPERTIMGSEYFRFNELTDNLKLLRRHRTYLQPIITHTFPVTDIQHAFELFFQGNTGKVIIEQ